MTSVETTEHAPRRKWGWIFVALLLVEVVIFSIHAHNLTEEIKYLRSYLNTTIAELTLVKIDNRTKELDRSYLISGASLIGTLVCVCGPRLSPAQDSCGVGTATGGSF